MIAVVVLKMEVCLAGIEEVAVCLPTTLFHRLEINNAKWKMKQFIFSNIKKKSHLDSCLPLQIFNRHVKQLVPTF